MFGLGKVDGDLCKPPSTGWDGWKHYEIADLAMDVYCRTLVMQSKSMFTLIDL